MLKGTIVYKGEDGAKLAFKGIDTSTTFSGILTSYVDKGIELMAGDSSESNALSVRRFEVKLTSVKVECAKQSIDNRKVTLGFNTSFFCRLGALIRYCKHQCKASNAVDYTGFASVAGEYQPETTTTYNIFDSVGNILGEITLEYGEIKKLKVENDYFRIDIAEEDCPPMVLQKIEGNTTKGFSFSRDYLGFDVDFGADLSSDTNNTEGLIYKTLAEVQAAHPEKEFSYLLNKKYIIVDDEMLESVLEEIKDDSQGEYIIYDSETSGLDINFKSRIGQADQCVGIILSKKPGVSYFFPMQMKSIPNLCGGDHFYFMEHYIREIFETKKIVGHNAPFDWKVAYIYDINTNFVHDTMAIFALTLCAEREGMSFGLKELTKILFNRDALELQDLVTSNKWGDGSVAFWDLPAELVRLYACADTDNTRDLLEYAIKNDLLHRYGAEKIYQIEMVFSLAVAYQEFYGHHVDVTRIEQLNSDIQNEINTQKQKMVSMLGHDFNPNSPQQLVNILYHELGIPEQISRKTGRPTTDKETLKTLSEITDIHGDPMYPFVVHLIEYRKAEGVRKIISQFDELATEDGFLFSSVMQYGTTTGRVSINTPNYQSYNDTVKKYITPRQGFYMADTDYSSVEYRVIGNMSGNEKIKEGFYDPDFDYHTYQAARMYDLPYAAVTKEARKAAKGVNFGIPYGMGDKSLGVRIFGEESDENTAKAGALKKKYFAGQEDVYYFLEDARDNGEINGYTETYFGRRRYYHPSKFSKAAIRRQAGNAVIQGTAADIYKLAVGRVFLRICKEGLLGKVLFPGFIHDELLLEIHESIDPMHFLKMLREEFEVKIDGWCPLYMGFGFGRSWKEAKSVEWPIQLQWEMVEKYGESGYPNWCGNSVELCEGIPDLIRDFSIRHIYDELTLEKAQNCEIKPATNSQMFDILKEDASLVSKEIRPHIRKGFKVENLPKLMGYVNDYYYKSNADDFHKNFKKIINSVPEDSEFLTDFRNDVDKVTKVIADEFSDGKQINEKSVFDRVLSQCFNAISKYYVENEQEYIASISDEVEKALRDENIVAYTMKFEDGSYHFDILDLTSTNVSSIKKLETQDAITLFCKLHNYDRSAINVLSIDTSGAEKQLDAFNNSIEGDFLNFEEDNQLNIDKRIDALGMYLDTENSRVILKLVPKVFMKFIKDRVNRNGKGYRVYFKDSENQKLYETETCLESENIQAIQQMYITYFSTVAK